MKRIKIFKVYFVLWLFVYFIAISNIETFKLYFLSTLTFNIAIVAILAIGTIMLLKGAKEVVMLAGTFGVLMYKKRNLPFYIRGIEKVLPSNIAQKITKRAENNLLLFTQQEKEEILSWIDEQFANQNKYNNFFIGTVLMIGLLGTFSGLLGAIGSMANIVMSLSGSNVDIGKIMSDFSGPLGSMAVGFGSSLFGVISAILLSIKGYLLNRAQASVLDGVENWLNANTVDTLQVETAHETGVEIGAKQPALMDIFVENMAALQQEIAQLNRSNSILHEAFGRTLHMLKEMQEREHQTMQMITAYMQTALQESRLAHEKVAYLTKVTERQERGQYELLSQLIALQQKESTLMTDINTQLEDLVYLSQKAHETPSHSEEHQEQKIALFQVADAIDAMHKSILHEIRRLEKGQERAHPENVEDIENSSFLARHFGLKRHNSREEV